LKNTSVVRVVADPGRARKVKKVEAISGKGCWEEEVAESRLLLSAPSFAQVNTAQAEKLVELVLAGLEVEAGDYVADLYAGAGTFTLPLAAAGACVVAVESAGSSVRDLRRNAERAGADIDIVGGDAARELPELGELDALVVDPPRAGLADGVVASIAAASPRRVAYVSCDASTWARDAARFEQEGYRLIRATPVDLFPQTYHVEVVSIFERSGS
ncbi:MAG: 23S rRNA (uracil(1939)-C(5))-methyltransferase RlmD, partial [Adlercreutzia sp.]|nr:23S rRNA (uracil(1939)-C(5))-methyltransferase RlmD [Adlercreutzia sp.]